MLSRLGFQLQLATANDNVWMHPPPGAGDGSSFVAMVKEALGEDINIGDIAAVLDSVKHLHRAE
eukprot:1083717-Amphidinium_carterae.1